MSESSFAYGWITNYYKYEWDIYYIHGWITSHFTHMNETYIINITHMTHMSESFSHMDELRTITLDNCPVTSDSRWHIYLLHNMLHMTRMSESSFAYGWITSHITHILRIYVTNSFICVICLICMCNICLIHMCNTYMYYQHVPLRHELIHMDEFVTQT